MTRKQDDRIKEYEIERKNRGENTNINWIESDQPESRGILFADVDGVSLMVYTDGLISIPAVRSYHPPKYATPMLAALSAKELWAKQKARDDRDLKKAKSCRSGHLSPIVHSDLKCENSVCPCQSEDSAQGQRRARGGFNTNPDRCS
jgi:hypothetical protein